MRKTSHIGKKVCMQMLLIALHLLGSISVFAQEPVRNYTVKDGKMYIELSKHLRESSLDSFIVQFDLGDLALKEFIHRSLRDSLIKQGWKIEKNADTYFVISKPLLGFDKIKNPAEKILFTEKHISGGKLFPGVISTDVAGVNRFRNKKSFAIRDSIVTFFLRNNQRASRVVLSGSFNDWSTDNLPMQKVDSGWIKEIKLAPGKYWYKFIIDGNWTTDKDNRVNENDGEGNINSVYYKPNFTIQLDSFSNARKVVVAGSFNRWDAGELVMEKTEKGWRLPIFLGEGTHTYRFVVDGRWMADPFNPDKVPNEFGEFNSVIRLGTPYIIQLEGYTNARVVNLVGSFNGWKQDELFMRKTGSGWELPYHLAPGNYEYQFIVDGKRLGRKEGNGNLHFVIQPNFEFRLPAFQNAGSVYLAGDFNNWSPNGFPMRKEGDEWVLTMHLSPGKHTYKYVVDGNWILDPFNKLWEQNEYDTGNSVIWMKAE